MIQYVVHDPYDEDVAFESIDEAMNHAGWLIEQFLEETWDECVESVYVYSREILATVEKQVIAVRSEMSEQEWQGNGYVLVDEIWNYVLTPDRNGHKQS